MMKEVNSMKEGIHPNYQQTTRVDVWIVSTRNTA